MWSASSSQTCGQAARSAAMLGAVSVSWEGLSAGEKYKLREAACSLTPAPEDGVNPDWHWRERPGSCPVQ